MKQSSADTFLSLREKEAVIAAVRKAERHTAGEIIPLIVNSSGEYDGSVRAGVFLIAFTGAYIAAWVINRLFYHTLDTLFVCGTLSVFFTAVLLAVAHFLPAFRRKLIPRAEMEYEVREAALAQFYKQGLYKTRDRTGVLLYVSVFERKVWILGDSGINTLLPEGTWDEIVSDIIKGFRRKRRGDALVQGVERIGSLLAAHFPIQAGDTNELKDLMIEGESVTGDE